jgi:hypothetical protein
MASVREQAFRCDFESRSLHVFAHVCAWDAPEALGLFEDELRAEGVELPGRIEVKLLGDGTLAATARFTPGQRAGWPRSG